MFWFLVSNLLIEIMLSIKFTENIMVRHNNENDNEMIMYLLLFKRNIKDTFSLFLFNIHLYIIYILNWLR